MRHTIRVGFIFPSSDYLFDPFGGDPHTHYQLFTILEKQYGAVLELFLIDLRGIDRRFAHHHIPECDMYLHSVYTLDYPEQYEIVRHLRQQYPLAKHIAGALTQLFTLKRHSN